MSEGILVATGSVALIVSLALAWLLVARRHLGIKPLQQLFRNDPDLLRAHIDFLMMATLLYAVAALGGPEIPVWISVAAALGALVNPSIFVLTSVRPEWKAERPAWFSLVSTVSFLATTLGFGGAALLLLWAVVRA